MDASCAVRAAGRECRAARAECDLPEYCTGRSEFCPPDTHKLDGLACDGARAHCHAGRCRSHADQCRLLWGSSGNQSSRICYEMNVNGSRSGNCGLDRPSERYRACARADVLCGMLHCRHLNEKLEFGMDSVAITSHAFMNVQGSIIPCRTALVDLGTQQPDPGLVPDGASCGQDKMCVSQRCVSVESVTRAAAALPGSVCPSDCGGHGVCNDRGSCHCERGFAPPLCDAPGAGGSLQSGPASDPGVHHTYMVTLYAVFLGALPAGLLLLLLYYYARHQLGRTPPRLRLSPGKRLQRRLTSKLSFPRAPPRPPAAASAPAPPATPSAHTLLPQATPLPDFFGHFKGFSLAPLQPEETPPPPTEDKLVPARTAPAPPAAALAPPPAALAPPPAALVPATTLAPPPGAGFMSTLRRNNSSVHSRIKALMGDKPAPSLFPAAAAAAAAAAAPARPVISSPVLEASTCSALRPAQPRPLGPPRPLSLEADVLLKPLPAEPAPPAPRRDPTPLGRIASLLRVERARPPLSRSHSLPRRAPLRLLPISAPLPLERELPVAALPLPLARAHSVRAPRPTSPPPPAPPAPLAHIGEELTDNIYAVIEDAARPLRTAPAPPPVGYTTPRAAPAAPAADLLGEIVSEIQTRNLESIYSSAPAPASSPAAPAAPAAAPSSPARYANTPASPSRLPRRPDLVSSCSPAPPRSPDVLSPAPALPPDNKPLKRSPVKPPPPAKTAATTTFGSGKTTPRGGGGTARGGRGGAPARGRGGAGVARPRPANSTVASLQHKFESKGRAAPAPATAGKPERDERARQTHY